MDSASQELSTNKGEVLQVGSVSSETQMTADSLREKPPFSAPATLVNFEVGTGPAMEVFVVHKEYAIKGSKVFEKAFNGPFTEGVTQIYQLEDVEPDVFRYFVGWLYTERLELKLHNSGEVYNKSNSAAKNEHHKLCKPQAFLLVRLWVLGDRYHMPTLQNKVMGFLLRMRAQCTSILNLTINYIYESTAKDSQLRSLVVENYINCLRPGLEHIPHEMLVSVAIILKKGYHFDYAKHNLLVDPETTRFYVAVEDKVSTNLLPHPSS